MKQKTWNFDENEVIDAAKELGIKLTAAELGTEICQAWADRVLQAKAQFDRGDMEACKVSIDEANACAI
jgi:hypothetical protein